MCVVVTTRSFAKALARLPVNWQKRIVAKIKEGAANPCGEHNNVTREDELIPLAMTEWRLKGEAALRMWREHRKLTQVRLAKQARVSRALIAAIETKRETGPVSTWKKLGAALGVSWEHLA